MQNFVDLPFVVYNVAGIALPSTLVHKAAFVVKLDLRSARAPIRLPAMSQPHLASPPSARCSSPPIIE